MSGRPCEAASSVYSGSGSFTSALGAAERGAGPAVALHISVVAECAAIGPGR
jgi:hypothetical protein